VASPVHDLIAVQAQRTMEDLKLTSKQARLGNSEQVELMLGTSRALLVATLGLFPTAVREELMAGLAKRILADCTETSGDLGEVLVHRMSQGREGGNA
jgi:hypothetical protein